MQMRCTYRFRVLGEVRAYDGIFMSRKGFGSESLDWIESKEPCSNVFACRDEASILPSVASFNDIDGEGHVL